MSFWYLEIDEKNVDTIQQHFGKFRQHEKYVPIKVGNYVVISRHFQGFAILTSGVFLWHMRNCCEPNIPYKISLEELLSYKLWENEPYKKPIDNLPDQYRVVNITKEMYSIIREYYGLSKFVENNFSSVTVDTDICEITSHKLIGKRMCFDEWVELSNLTECSIKMDKHIRPLSEINPKGSVVEKLWKLKSEIKLEQ